MDRKTYIENSTKNFYWTAFKSFLKIGMFTIGGGYAMIPLIEHEIVDKHKWIDKDEFLNLLAVAQSCPGVFAVNISIFIGYKLKKNKGAICTCVGTVLPSFIIILTIALFLKNFIELKTVAAIFRGIRPAVVALIAVPTFNLAKRAKINRFNIWIPIITAFLIVVMGINPIFILFIAGLSGFIYGKLTK